MLLMKEFVVHSRLPSIERFEDRLALTTSWLAFDLGSLSRAAAVSIADNNDTTATAVDLGILTEARSQQGFVGRSDVRDVFRFELPDPGQVDLLLAELSDDADLFLLDATRNVVARSDNAGAQEESIQAELDAGEYFVIVSRYRYWDATQFRLDLSATLRPDAAGSTFDTAADVGNIAGVNNFEGTVGYGPDHLDMIQFAVDTASNLQVDLSSLTADLDLYLFDADGQRLATSGLSSNTDERIEASIEVGTYYLAVVPSGNAESAYTLRVSQSAVVQETPPASPAVLNEVAYFGSTNQWGVNLVNAPEAWAAGYRGSGVTVAIVDSGVDLDHPDLVDNIWVNTDEILGDGIDNDGNGFVDDRYGWDFVSGDNDPDDGNGHGTHVAGIVAAANNGVGVIGVAFDAEIMPIRVLNNAGSGSNFGVARGIRYAVDNGADIINLSLGGGYDASIHAAIRYAHQNDVFVVGAAGNESAGIPSFPARFSAAFASVLSVGAFDRNSRPASFSNRVGNSNAVQIDAPGVSIYSTVPADRYQRLSGTSMAAPYVAGVAALTLSANPELTSVELRRALVDGATSSIGGSDAVGIVNAARTIPLALA